MVTLVGLTESLRVMQRRSTVTNAAVSLSIPPAEIPRFRAVHEELINLDEDFGSKFSGVLTDQEGRVRALWGSYSEQVHYFSVFSACMLCATKLSFKLIL